MGAWNKSIDKWLNTLQPPILVVGNGVLVQPVPEEEYQTVIRINNYALGGLSGNKVTHWVANGYPDIEPRPMPCVLIPWTWDLAIMRGSKLPQFKQRLGDAVQVLVTSDNKHIRWWFPAAAQTGKRFPTTGFCVLSLLFSRKIKPDLVGFDGLRTGHMANPSFQHGHKGTIAKELLFLNSWSLRRR